MAALYPIHSRTRSCGDAYQDEVVVAPRQKEHLRDARGGNRAAKDIVELRHLPGSSLVHVARRRHIEEYNISPELTAKPAATRLHSSVPPSDTTARSDWPDSRALAMGPSLVSDAALLV